MPVHSFCYSQVLVIDFEIELILTMKKHLLAGLALSLFLVGHLHAGAWVQKRHGYYFKLSANYLYATDEFNHEGDKQNISPNGSFLRTLRSGISTSSRIWNTGCSTS